MRNNTALLIIDMQNDFVLPGAPLRVAGAVAVIPNIRRILQWFRRSSLPVFHVVREYRADGSDIETFRLREFLSARPCCVPGTDGCDIVDELTPEEGEYRLVKNRFSAFMNTELDFMLRRLGVDHIVVCGIQYPNCVRATIFDAVAIGYRVTLVTDAAGAQNDEVARANIHDIANIGVACVSTDQFLRTQSQDRMQGAKSIHE